MAEISIPEFVESLQKLGLAMSPELEALINELLEAKASRALEIIVEIHKELMGLQLKAEDNTQDKMKDYVRF